LRLGEAIGRPAIIEKRPSHFTDDEHIGLFRDALARLATVLAHQRERIGSFH
jgi:hypothetical protein